MHDCKHALYPNQVSPRRLISPRKLVTNPRQRVGRGGRTKEKSCHERTGWWCWWQWWWMKKSLPISGLCRLSLSLSPTPLNVSPLLLFFFLSLRGYLQYTLSLYQVAALRLVLPLWGKSQPQLSRPCFTTANEASKKKKTNKVVKYFCLPPPPKKKKNPTHVQRYKLRSFCFYQAPFWVVRSSWKSLENSSQTWCSPPAQRLQAAPRQRRNTRAIRHCLPFSSGDIEYISRLNLIRNTAEWQGPIVFATTMVTEITG